MLTRLAPAFAGILLLLGFDAAAQMGTGSGGGDRNFQVQVTTLLRETEKQMNALTEKVRTLEDQVARLSQDVAEARKAAAAEKGANDRLEAEISKLRSNLDETNRSVKKAIDSTNEVLAKIPKQVEDSMGKAMTQINQKLTAAQQATIAQVNKEIEKTNVRTAKAAAEAAPEQPAGEFVEYVVEQGATMAAIAKAFKVTVDEIKKANNLKDNNIRVGQKLLIPKK